MDMLDEAAEKPKDDADVRVGRRVRALRLERKLSLADLAAKAGVSIGALSQIERGMSSLRVKVIWPLAAALDIEPSALIADGNDAVNDLYCVRANSRRADPGEVGRHRQGAAVAAGRDADRHAGDGGSRRRHGRSLCPCRP